MHSLSLLLLLTAAPSGAAPDGRALLERFECHRCHEGTGLDAMSETRHCVRCHQNILLGRFEAPKETLAKWGPRLTSLQVVPSLAGVGRVLRRDWVETFLLSPHDLRPHLPATMPRLAMSREEAAALAAHLVPGETTTNPPDSARVERGRVIYRRLRCGDCHQFSGSGENPRDDSPYRALSASVPAAAPMQLAPDLRYARERLQAGSLSAWIANPAALRPDTLMPSHQLERGEADALAAFVWHAALGPAPAPRAEVRRAVLSRRVSYAEVEAAVFRKVCWHCHSAPDYNRGDGGPGNTGGFGFAGRGLDLSSYQSVAAGLLGATGERQSVFAMTRDGVPRLLAVLLARRAEERGEVVEGVRGMPLGLPSLSDEQIQLVESWIAQGRPR